MSAFAIYAFVITGLYIVYMAVVIMMDLFGKKGQKKDGAEVFNNDDMGGDNDEEQSTVVDESDEGYVIHQPGEQHDDDNGGSPVVEHENDDVAQEEQPVNENLDDEAILDQESQESQAFYERVKAVQAKMDPVTPTYQDEYSSSEFAVLMAQPLSNKSKILRSLVQL